MVVKQYEVYWIALDPTQDSEITKKRIKAVIIGNAGLLIGVDSLNPFYIHLVLQA